jgi:hypothetical protein
MLDVVVLLFFVMHVYHALDDLDCFNMVQRFWFFGEHVSFKTLKPGVLLGSCHPQCVLLAFTRPLDPLQPGKPGAKVLYSSRRPSLRMRTQCEAGDHLRSSDKARTQFVRFILGNQITYISYTNILHTVMRSNMNLPECGPGLHKPTIGDGLNLTRPENGNDCDDLGMVYGYKSHITWRNGPN